MTIPKDKDGSPEAHELAASSGACRAQLAGKAPCGCGPACCTPPAAAALAAGAGSRHTTSGQNHRSQVAELASAGGGQSLQGERLMALSNVMDLQEKPLTNIGQSAGSPHMQHRSLAAPAGGGLPGHLRRLPALAALLQACTGCITAHQRATRRELADEWRPVGRHAAVLRHGAPSRQAAEVQAATARATLPALRHSSSAAHLWRGARAFVLARQTRARGRDRSSERHTLRLWRRRAGPQRQGVRPDRVAVRRRASSSPCPPCVC